VQLPRLTFNAQGSNLAELETKVKNEVDKIIDPETGMTFGQMGLIQSVKEQEPGVVKIDFVPTSPYCPIAFKFALDIKATAKKVNGIKKAYVYVHGHSMEQNINQMVNKAE
jgi:metal-sulfur cluster biosynthetic enzyme